MRGGAPTGEEISSFLDNATPGSIATFQKSPWGSNVSVIVQKRYFSASGMICAHLDVAREGAVPSSTGATSQSGSAPQSGVVPGSVANYGQRAQVACLVQGKGWYTQRLVTQLLAAPSTS
ncbi:DVU3141 family protein [Salinicola corii]